MTNSVVPMPNAPAVRAYSAIGMRWREAVVTGGNPVAGRRGALWPFP